ncbi:hypothetical protein CPB83DRAFT_907928 [Crepidotus variabilis]|uniref:Uncharacterized protein n=1 Tax=Crepidotus variabilis TaxID=179855 RepID=A0A9P6EDR7_9AGAR|nr:hypothetical protein CPB83DRAFT_907928 [Crepidotus variabilis]
MEVTSQWQPHLPPPSFDAEEAQEIQGALETLTRVIHVLNIPDAKFTSYATAINALSEQHLALSRSLVRLRTVENDLKEHLFILQAELRLINHWNQVLVPGSSESLLEAPSTLERRRDAMLKKAKEYHRELEALAARQPLNIPVSLGQLLLQKESNVSKEKEMKEKRARLQAFHGLPPNLELARHELRMARQKQTELIQLRERLLRKMAEAVE